MRIILLLIFGLISQIVYCQEPEIYHGIGQVTVLSGEAISLPFEAKIKTCYIRPGQYVKKKQALFLLDYANLDKELQKLEVEHLELKQSLYELDKNNLTFSESELNLKQAFEEKAYAQKRQMDSQKLLQAGIISQEEYLWDKRRFQQAQDQYNKQLAVHRHINDRSFLKEKRFLIIKKIRQTQTILYNIKKYISNSIFYAPSDGLALPIKLKSNEFNCQAGEKLSSEQAIFWLAPLENRRIELKMDQLELQQVKVGQKAEVVYHGNPNKKYASEIMEIDSIPESNNLPPKYKVFLKVGDVPDLKLGTQARVKIYFD